MPKRHASSTEPALKPNVTRRVSVLLPLPLGTAYDYRQPADMALTPGDFVLVPLGRRQTVGVVWGEGDPGGIEESRLKDVIARLNNAVQLSVAEGDNGSRELFEKMLVSEEEHADWLEAQIDLIETVGLQNYLTQQIHE